jgi:hypothetical protein
MDNDSYLKDIRKGRKESVDFFASQNKFIRESWVVAEFLTNLSIPFIETDFKQCKIDPPDVVFGEAQFEVKEGAMQNTNKHLFAPTLQSIQRIYFRNIRRKTFQF